ncbi:ROK family protein [Bremerella cremea]|uniref:ROK family protein n=1 Tax=Bremerella cremea TaxID=1031537 RepID=A0A368KUD7_9BACT|nr:ROK family protein [Bremerella cremea]RCS53989.1 ROK family protein [Bremerella cremea]
MIILSIDVGGSNVKFLLSNSEEKRKFASGPELTGQQMVDQVKQNTADWKFDAISIGIPAPVIHGKVIHDPHNLGSGWSGFDFSDAFGLPTKVVNDAAMQALGDYKGGRMLFLGLGTGLGSAMIVEGVLQPMELAHLPFKKGKTFEEYVGQQGRERLGKKRWRLEVIEAITMLTAALEPEYVVLGGGNAKLMDELPENVTVCANGNAFLGGFRMWDEASPIKI